MGTKKAKIEMEFERDELVGTMMLMGEMLTDEMWDELTEAPIKIDCSIAGSDEVGLKVALIAIAMASLKKK